jgi:hypothetical protein
LCLFCLRISYPTVTDSSSFCVSHFVEIISCTCMDTGKSSNFYFDVLASADAKILDLKARGNVAWKFLAKGVRDQRVHHFHTPGIVDLAVREAKARYPDAKKVIFPCCGLAISELMFLLHFPGMEAVFMDAFVRERIGYCADSRVNKTCYLDLIDDPASDAIVVCFDVHCLPAQFLQLYPRVICVAEDAGWLGLGDVRHLDGILRRPRDGARHTNTPVRDEEAVAHASSCAMAGPSELQPVLGGRRFHTKDRVRLLATRFEDMFPKGAYALIFPCCGYATSETTLVDVLNNMGYDIRLSVYVDRHVKWRHRTGATPSVDFTTFGEAAEFVGKLRCETVVAGFNATVCPLHDYDAFEAACVASPRISWSLHVRDGHYERPGDEVLQGGVLSVRPLFYK